MLAADKVFSYFAISIDMTQIFLPSKPDVNSQKLYCYINQTNKIIIARIDDLTNRNCERVVFPGEKFLFKAQDDYSLKISQQTNIGMIEDRIPCSQIKTVDNAT